MAQLPTSASDRFDMVSIAISLLETCHSPTFEITGLRGFFAQVR
jgi:hypothetical protein